MLMFAFIKNISFQIGLGISLELDTFFFFCQILFLFILFTKFCLLLNFTFKIGKNPVRQNNHGKYLKTF